MSREKKLRATLLYLIGAFIACLLILVQGVKYITTNDFCTSCHSMSFASEEYKRSRHFTSPTGIRTGCADCHVGTGLGRVLVFRLIASDLWTEIRNPIRDKGEWEKRRKGLAEKVRRGLKDNSRCSDCHDISIMKPVSGRRWIAHARISPEGMGCLECHRNLVHGEVD